MERLMAVAATRECMLCVHMDFSVRKSKSARMGAFLISGEKEVDLDFYDDKEDREPSVMTNAQF